MPVTADLYYHLYEGSEEGQRPSVILLHGAGGTHLHWPSEMRRLPGYRVFAPDLPGHGKSGGRGQQSISAYANAVVEWLDAVELHSAVFVGHSMGSAIALRLALDHAEHVLGLGLVGGGARLRVHPELLEGTASQTTFDSAVQAIVSYSFCSQTPAQFVDLARQRMAETRPSVLHGDLLACDLFDETDRIGQITRPILVMCGAEDKLIPVRYSQFLADSIPGAEFKIIPNAGHMVMLEQPQAAAAALAAFLAAIPYQR